MGDDPGKDGGKTDPTSHVDVEKLGELMRLMAEHDVTELEIRNPGEKYRLRRGPDPAMAGYTVVSAPPQAAPAIPTPSTPVASPDTSASAPAPKGVFITSPEVGTFYRKRDPESPELVSVGDRVSPDTVVCLIEQMKVFNEITAGVNGTIAEVLVSDGDLVEFDTSLFRVEPG